MGVSGCSKATNDNNTRPTRWLPQRDAPAAVSRRMTSDEVIMPGYRAERRRQGQVGEVGDGLPPDAAGVLSRSDQHSSTASLEALLAARHPAMPQAMASERC
jgi:hypothetical protein